MLRTLLPDRAGSLGLVATAMGTVGADILAVEIVERRGPVAVTDFMLELPQGGLPDHLVSVCNDVPNVRVEWLSHYPESWGLESDIELLTRMTDDPESAAENLAEAVPVVFHCHWSLLAGANPPRALACTELAPQIQPAMFDAIGPLDAARTLTLPHGWMEGWNEAELAMAPLSGERALVAVRQGGPEWLESELARLQFLANFVP